VDTDCPFFIPAERRPRCGFILVPEDRGKPDGRNIRIRAAVFKSESATPPADPIVFLDGGPGSNTLEALQYDLEVFEPLLAERDLLLFDQRGAGSSDPPLECAELKEMFYGILGEPRTPEEHRAQELRDAENCRDTLSRSGADLAAYNSAENAADLEDLRLALGYAQWNLYGGSYGTKLALTAMRDFPAGIRSAADGLPGMESGELCVIQRRVLLAALGAVQRPPVAPGPERTELGFQRSGLAA